jgi:serine protein kinase
MCCVWSAPVAGPIEQRLVDEYGYDSHSAREALNYVTSLLAQE